MKDEFKKSYDKDQSQILESTASETKVSNQVKSSYGSNLMSYFWSQSSTSSAEQIIEQQKEVEEAVEQVALEESKIEQST